MNPNYLKPAPSGGVAAATLRSALLAAGLLSSSALAQVQKAGDLLVDVDATQLSEGALPSIKNNGTLGGVFAATGPETAIPAVAVVGGTKGIRFDGGDFLQLVTAVGGTIVPPPAGLVGEDPSRSIEVWTINPEVAGEETLVSWGKRGGPDGSNVSFGYGSDFRWGAVGHWGGDGPDLGWSNDGGNPAPNKWHHLVYTFDPTTHTSRVYANGKLANGEILDTGRLNTHPDTSILIGAQLDGDGTTVTGGLRYTGAIAKVRIHDGTLTGAQVAANYELEKAAFSDPQPPAPPVAERLNRGPVHRYSFSDAAVANAVGGKVKDSVGTADGVIQGDSGAALTGSRLRLDGGPSTSAAYLDLPNGLVSINSTNKGGSGGFTFETWFRINGAQTWSRIFDFGSSTSDDGSGEVQGPGGGGTGLDYFEYSAQIGDDVNNRRLELRNEDPAGGGIATFDSPTRSFGRDVHVVVTWDEKTGAVRLYEDGEAKGGLTTDDPMSDLNDVNVWLGRSNWSGDRNTQGEYDEARFYNYVLTPGQVLGDYLAGADLINDRDIPVTIATHPANVTVPETLNATFSVSARGSTPMTFQWMRNNSPIDGATSPNYNLTGVTSADNGASFTVKVTNNGGTVTSSPAVLSVVSDTIALKHRYSFNETSGTQVTDSVGNAHGTVNGAGTFGGGSLTLDGTDGTFVDLPNGLLTGLGDNGTIEIWATYNGGPNWSRLFDFGSSTGGENEQGGGVDYFFYTPKTAQGFPRFVANFPDGGDVATLNHPGANPVGEQEHIVITYSFTGNTSRLYTNGTLVASGPAPRKLSDFKGTENNLWLGKSQWADPYYNGKYNELRLYSGALTPAQVAASFTSGPGTLPAAAPKISLTRSGANVQIVFEGSLEAADHPTGPWTAVNGTSPANIPTTGPQKYYRSRR
jgi:hypothetical protein